VLRSHSEDLRKAHHLLLTDPLRLLRTRQDQPQLRLIRTDLVHPLLMEDARDHHLHTHRDLALLQVLHTHQELQVLHTLLAAEEAHHEVVADDRFIMEAAAALLAVSDRVVVVVDAVADERCRPLIHLNSSTRTL
jgi:hypothetical protein